MSKIKQYFEQGIIDDLVKAGFVSPSKLAYIQYVRTVEVFMNEGMGKSEAVVETSIKCRVCESTVWKSIKTME